MVNMSDPTGRGPGLSPASGQPVPHVGWPAWGWLLLALGAVLTLTLEAWVLLWLSFGMSAEQPSPETVAAAERASRDLMIVLLVPWAVATAVLHPRLRIALTGLLCATPAAEFWLEMHGMGLLG